MIYNAFEFLGEKANMRTLDDRINFQKRVYFLQHFAGGLDYDFGWYTYGPYLYDVTLAGYRVQAWQNSKIEVPEMTQLPKDTLEQYRDFLTETRSMSDKGERYWVELLSSLHFLYVASNPRPYDKEKTFDTLELIKPGRFSEEDKGRAWELLGKYNLIHS